MRTAATLAVVAQLAAGAVHAQQIVGLGSTVGGTVAQTSNTIAKVVAEHSGLQMRPQPMAGTDKYMIVVDRGELEFGSSNMMQYYQGITGTDPTNPMKHENLRLVATLMVYVTGVLVRNDSPIKTTADLKGTRAPEGFPGATLFQNMMTGFLANGGLTWNDVVKVAVSDLAKHLETFKLGRTDMAIAVLNSAPAIELNATIESGVRYIDLATTGPGARKMLEIMPKTYYVDRDAAPGMVGVRGKIHMAAFDYVMWAYKGVPDDTVYRVAKAMYENEAEFKEASPIWRSHFSKNMAKDQGAPYHPGAEKFYREAGIWQR